MTPTLINVEMFFRNGRVNVSILQSDFRKNIQMVEIPEDRILYGKVSFCLYKHVFDALFSGKTSSI